MSKRRSHSKRSSKPHVQPAMPKAAAVIGFSEAEEAFFRAGDSEQHLAQVAYADDIDATHEAQRPSLWRRLFARAALAA